MNLNKREVATVLAAMRYWQQDLEKYIERTNEETLNAEEIDDLCERINCDSSDLNTAIALSRSKGLEGIAVVLHGAGYLALCINREGMVSDPRNWHHKETPEEAIKDLIRVMS